ncbi:MAG: HNH endonuclease [Candidatus Thorarchaeota archaeon]
MTGKTYRDTQGYLRFKDSGKSVHRWKAEKKLRRKLRPGEVVHHKNRIKSDNRYGNLEILGSRLEHRARHAKKAWERTRRPRSLRRR